MTKVKYRIPKEVGMTNRQDDFSRRDAEQAEAEFWGVDIERRVGELRDGPASGRHAFDLEERTARFGEAIIRFAKKIPTSPANNRLIGQLVGAGTSVGANYCEADDAVSRKDFAHKMGTCRKEARETRFFLRMVATAEPDLKAEARELWQEAKELNLIFSAIWRKSKSKNRTPNTE